MALQATYNVWAWSCEIHTTKVSAVQSARAWMDASHLVEPVKKLDDDRFYFVYRNVPGYWNGKTVKDGVLVS